MLENLTGKLTIEKLAAQKGLNVQEIKDEINIAIEIAMNHPDVSIQQFWRNIPCKGAKPTPEEVITYLASKVQK